MLSETALSLPAGPLQTALLSITPAAHNVLGLGLIAAHSHSHAHRHGHVPDLNVRCTRLLVSYRKSGCSVLRVRLRTRRLRIVPCCLRMRIITGVMRIRALSLWSQSSEAVGSLRCLWTLSEVRIFSHTVDAFLCFFNLKLLMFLI